jgi:hypothetical protein
MSFQNKVNNHQQLILRSYLGQGQLSRQLRTPWIPQARRHRFVVALMHQIRDNIMKENSH